MKKIKRPWGYYKILYQTNNLWVKEIFIEPKKKTSLQSHKKRDELWFPIKGDGMVENDGQVYNDFLKMSFLSVKNNQKHRLIGGEKEGLLIIEIALGQPKEEDIIRYQDDYGRIRKTT